MDMDLSIVFDHPERSDFVHEKIDAIARRANHFSKRLLINLADYRLIAAFLPVIGQQEQNSRETPLARIEKLIDQSFGQLRRSLQDVREQEFGKARILVNGTEDDRLFQPRNDAFSNGRCSPQAQWLANQATLATEISHPSKRNNS